jgi:glyoxalase family protein
LYRGLAGGPGDTRRGYGDGAVPSEHGIKGGYAPVISVIDPEEIVMYLETGLEAKQVDEDGPHRALEVAGGFGGRLELVHEPNLRPGTWHFAEGTPHHWAWDVVDQDIRWGLRASSRDSATPT